MAKEKTILIAEDSDTTQKVFVFLLEKHGYRVVAICSNGIEAVKKYKIIKPDIVLMDLAMPKMDGITAIKKIMAFDSTARVIAVSALYNPLMKEEAEKAGAKKYIIKPFEIPELIGAIEGCLYPDNRKDSEDQRNL